MGIWRLANLLSFTNALAGVSAIFFAVSGQLVISAHLIALAMFFDTLDGPIARWQGPTASGKLLDRVSDRITQTVAPAVLLFCLFSFHPIAFVLGVALVFTGLLRLIRTEAPSDLPSRGFPLSPAALLIITGVFISAPSWLLVGLLMVAIILSLSTLPVRLPDSIRKPAVSQTNRKQIILVAAKALPLLFLALPVLPLFEGTSYFIFFLMGVFLIFGIFSSISHFFRRKKDDAT